MMYAPLLLACGLCRNVHAGRLLPLGAHDLQQAAPLRLRPCLLRTGHLPTVRSSSSAIGSRPHRSERAASPHSAPLAGHPKPPEAGPQGRGRPRVRTGNHFNVCSKRDKVNLRPRSRRFRAWHHGGDLPAARARPCLRMLDAAEAKSRADLGRNLRCSRARVTKVLGTAPSGLPVSTALDDSPGPVAERLSPAPSHPPYTRAGHCICQARGHAPKRHRARQQQGVTSTDSRGRVTSTCGALKTPLAPATVRTTPGDGEASPPAGS